MGMSRVVTLFLIAAPLCAAPAARKWHNAEVVFVKNVAIFRVYEIVAAWRQGILYPRWAPDFYYGYGYPVFDYYSTLSYYLAAAYAWFFGAVAGVNFTRTLAFLMTRPMGWFVWVEPKLQQYVERMTRDLTKRDATD